MLMIHCLLLFRPLRKQPTGSRREGLLVIEQSPITVIGKPPYELLLRSSATANILISGHLKEPRFNDNLSSIFE